jgi:hypothetical protein
MKTYKQLFSEANKGPDNLVMSVPLFIRCLEWAREEAKTDIEVHEFVERAIKLNGPLDTSSYEKMIAEEVVLETNEFIVHLKTPHGQTVRRKVKAPNHWTTRDLQKHYGDKLVKVEA